MYIGHYGFSFLLKKKFKQVPLWLHFVSVQFVDLLAFVLAVFGIEKASYRAVENPFLRISIDHVPYTHSLTSSLIIAGLVLLVFWKLKGKIWGIALSIGVLSHWVLDLIVHTPDLPLLFDKHKVGLGLWNYPWITFIGEIAAFLLCAWFLYRGTKSILRPLILIGVLIGFFALAFFAPEKEVSINAMAITTLCLYLLFPALAYWSERSSTK